MRSVAQAKGARNAVGRRSVRLSFRGPGAHDRYTRPLLGFSLRPLHQTPYACVQSRVDRSRVATLAAALGTISPSRHVPAERAETRICRHTLRRTSKILDRKPSPASRDLIHSVNQTATEQEWLSRLSEPRIAHRQLGPIARRSSHSSLCGVPAATIPDQEHFCVPCPTIRFF